jgi:signal transduction histidine kinase
LRAVALDTIDPSPAPGDLSGLPPAADDAGATLYILRDVTDTRDLRPAREAFLAVLSHELRTPITTIYAGSSVLARRPTLSPPATRTLARDISAEAARLYDLVEDLLVLARLERRVLDPLDEPVLVQRAIDSTIRMAADRLGDAPVERRGDADVPPVHGDAVYVEHVCRNMILAGLRYAGREPGRELIVDVRSDRDAGEVTVAVLDRGPSLTAEELVRAFELPDPSAVGRLAGLGVGPFVSRHLVEAMGGRVWARNRPDGGLEMGMALDIDERA